MVERVCLTVEAGKTVTHIKELIGTDGLAGQGLQWNAAVTPDRDSPTEEMLLDLVVRVHHHRVQDSSPTKKDEPALAPLVLHESRAKSFQGCYEPEAGLQEGCVPKAVHFEFGNAFSWWRNKSVQLFLVPLQSRPPASLMPPLPALAPPALPCPRSRDRRGSELAHAKFLEGGEGHQVRLPAQRPPAAPRLDGGDNEQDLDDWYEGDSGLGCSSPKTRQTSGGAGGDGPSNARHQVGRLARLRMEAKRICDEIGPRRSALEALQADVLRRAAELEQLETSLENLMQDINEAQGVVDRDIEPGNNCEQDDANDVDIDAQQATGGPNNLIRRFSLHNDNLDVKESSSTKAEDLICSMGSPARMNTEASIQSEDDFKMEDLGDGSNSQRHRYSSLEQDYEDLIDVFGKARCGRCGQMLPLDPDAMEAHAEQCEAARVQK